MKAPCGEALVFHPPSATRVTLPPKERRPSRGPLSSPFPAEPRLRGYRRRRPSQQLQASAEHRYILRQLGVLPQIFTSLRRSHLLQRAAQLPSKTGRSIFSRYFTPPAAACWGYVSWPPRIDT